MDRNKQHFKKHDKMRKYDAYEIKKTQKSNPKSIFKQKPYASVSDIKLRGENNE